MLVGKKLVLLFIFFTFPQWAFAHKTFSSPPARYADIENEGKISFLGYGSFGASSDAQARSIVMPRCDLEKQKEYIKCAGGDFLRLLSSENLKNLDYNIRTASYHSLVDQIYESVQKKIFERSLLEYTGNNGNLDSVSVPRCLVNDDESQDLLQLAKDVTSNSPKSDAYNFLKTPTFENLSKLKEGSQDHRFVNRLQGIYNNTDHASVVRSLVLGEQIKSRHTRNGLYITNKGHLWWKKQIRRKTYTSAMDSSGCKKRCAIDKANFQELKNHHPEIYSGRSSLAADKLKDHLNTIIDIEEFNGEFEKKKSSYYPKPNPLYEFIEKDHQYTNPLPHIQRLIQKTKELAKEPPSPISSKQKKLIQAYQGMMLELDQIRELRNKDILSNFEKICELKKHKEKSIPKIKYLLENHPLEFRQAMLDLKDESKKAAFSLYLCARARGNDPKMDLNECNDFISNPRRNEVTVTGRKISRPNNSKSSSMGYVIKKGTPPLISTTIKLQKGPSLSDEGFEKFKQEKTKGINDYFNCQAGAIESYTDENGEVNTCPKYDPAKAKFKIKFVESGEAQLKFDVHQCYRQKAKEQLCDGGIKKMAIKSCTERMAARQKGLKLEDLFPDRSQIKIREKHPTSTYKRYALDCVEEAKDLSQCKGKTGCGLQTCTALACAVYPPEPGSCIEKEVINMICERRNRTPEELAENPFPLDKIPDSPANDSPEWNRADSSNLTASASPRVLRHELSHRMGIDDEYFDNEIYPIPDYGEEDSLMNGGNRMYPRHFDTILKPLHCLDQKASFIIP